MQRQMFRNELCLINKELNRINLHLTMMKMNTPEKRNDQIDRNIRNRYVFLEQNIHLTYLTWRRKINILDASDVDKQSFMEQHKDQKRDAESLVDAEKQYLNVKHRLEIKELQE